MTTQFSLTKLRWCRKDLLSRDKMFKAQSILRALISCECCRRESPRGLASLPGQTIEHFKLLICLSCTPVAIVSQADKHQYARDRQTAKGTADSAEHGQPAQIPAAETSLAQAL